MKVNNSNKLENRKHNYELKKLKIVNLMGERQEFALRLRKDKLDDEIMNKRMKYLFSTKVTQINVEELTIEEDFLRDYNQSSNKFNFLRKNLETKDTNIFKFCISHLKDYISEEKTGIEIDQTFVEFLFNVLLNDYEEDIKYECSLIIINLTYNRTEFFTKYLLEQELLSKIINLIGTTKFSITNNILYILGNLLSGHNSLQEYIVNHTKLKDKIIEYLPISHPNNVKKILLWNLNNIVNYLSSDEIEFILDCLNNNYLKNAECKRGVLLEALSFIIEISNISNQKYIDILFKLKINETIINSLRAISENMEKEYILLQVKLAKIISNMTLDEIPHIKELLDNELISVYEDILIKIINNKDFKKDYKCLANEICIAISNMSGVYDSLTRVIVKDSKLCTLILKLANLFNDINIKKQIVCVFYNCLNCESNKIKFELLRLPVIEYFIESLNINENDNLSMVLEGLKNLLEYGKEISNSFEIESNIVQKQIESLNGVNLIEKYVDSHNKEVSDLANDLISNYFIKSETNKINN